MARKLPVKWFYDNRIDNVGMGGAGGAPQLNGLAGSLVQVLDACLIDGFNTRSVVSFIIAGGVGTIEFGTSGHGFVLHQVVGIGGATDDQYNGDWRVTAVNTTSIEVDATGVADTTVAGTLTCKTAPVGDWEKAFSGTNKAAYRSTHADATGLLLRVDDSVGRYANVRGYEAMTDIDTGTGEFPTTAQRANCYWNKSSAANNSARGWTIVADERFFYFIPCPHTSKSSANLAFCFGDIESFIPGDLFHGIIVTSGTTTNSTAFGSDHGSSLVSTNARSSIAPIFVARSSAQIGSSKRIYFISAEQGSKRSGAGGSNGFPPYPAPDGALLLAKLKLVTEYTDNTIRGQLPGWYTCLQEKPLNHGDIVEDAGGAGRHVIMIAIGSDAYTDSYRFALDIIDGWR